MILSILCVPKYVYKGMPTPLLHNSVWFFCKPCLFAAGQGRRQLTDLGGGWVGREGGEVLVAPIRTIRVCEV